MNDKVKLSIILPAYNHEKYIAEAFDSILSQSFTDFEVIVVDDGSEDGTWSVIEKYSKQDHRIKAYRQKNRGTSKTQEAALKIAKGEWVTFCGSDDSFPAGALMALMKKTEGKDLIIGAHYRANDSGLREKVSQPKTKNLIKQLYFTGALWGKAFRKDFLLDNKVSFPDLLLEEDTVFLAEIAAATPRYAVIDRPVYEYWNHNLGAKSLSRRIDGKLFEHRLRGKEMALQTLEAANFVSECEHFFVMYSRQLTRQLPLLQDEFAEEAFSQFRQFVLNWEWTNQEKFFRHLFHINRDEFEKINHKDYCSYILQMEPGDYLVDMYMTGSIGFSYIAKFILAWLKFKTRGKANKWRF